MPYKEYKAIAEKKDFNISYLESLWHAFPCPCFRMMADEGEENVQGNIVRTWDDCKVFQREELNKGCHLQQQSMIFVTFTLKDKGTIYKAVEQKMQSGLGKLLNRDPLINLPDIARSANTHPVDPALVIYFQANPLIYLP